jgi:hypothetical protein
MTREQLYQHLENLLEQLGVSVIYDNLSDSEARTTSGLCKVKGRHFYIMDRSKGLAERTRLLAECLKQMDLEEVYVLPAVREFLDKGERGSEDL